MKHTYSLGAALLALGALAAGCSGGGGASNALPSTGPGTPQTAQRGHASFVITIPNGGTQSGSRTPRYISANTKSVSVVETDAGAAALAPVIANVTPGSPNCTTSASSTSCTLVVPANPGSDMFSVTAFDAANGTGNKLSTGSLNATITAGQDNTTVPVVLGGVVNSFTLTLSDAFAPIGTATTLNVAALDASGSTIVGTYDNPVTLSAGAGATLGVSNIAGSTQSSGIAVSYTGESSAPITITATGDGKTGTATLTPGSGIAYYNVGSNLTYNNGGFRIMTGSDGKIYYSALGACSVKPGSGLCTTTTGAIGQFDPATHTFQEYDNATNEVVGVYETPDGAIWAAEQSTTKIARFAPGTFPNGTPTEVAVPGNYWPRAFSVGPDGNLWYVGGGGTIAKIDLSVPFTSSAVTYYYAPKPTDPSTPRQYPFFNSMAWGSDGNIYATDQNNGQVDKVSPGGTMLGQYTLPAQAARTFYNVSARYITKGPDGTLYVTDGGDSNAYPANGALLTMTATGTFSVVAPPPSAYSFTPDALASGANGIAWSERGSSSFGSLSATGSLRELPAGDGFTNQLTGYGTAGVTFAPDGSPWFTCYGNASQPLCLGHVVLNTVWSVFPSRTANVYGVGQASSEYMGIAEAGDSSPFTITSANSAVATASHISDHNFEIDGVAAGTTTLTITDKNGRAVTVTVNVTTTTGSVQSHMRKSGGII